MTQTGKTTTIIIVILIVIGVIIGMNRGGKIEEQANKEPIKIGAIAPLTGDAAVYGEPARNVIQMAVDEINAACGIKGQQIELIFEDGKCNGKDGASAAQKLANVDKVQVIIGGFCSSESLASIPISETAKVALLSPGSSSPDLTGKSIFFNRNFPSDASQGIVLADAASKLGFKKVAMIQEQTDYALGIFTSFNNRFKALGGIVVKEEVAGDTVDFRSVIAKLQAEKPEMLFINVQTVQAASQILKQMNERKWKVKIFSNDVVIDNVQFISDNKDTLEGAVGAVFKFDPTNTKLSSVLANYKTKFGVEMPYQSYGQTEYDSVYMVKDAILAVGYDGQKISEWFRTIKDWPGASGAVTIGSNGDRVGGHSLEIVKNGKVEIYNP
jgi:branched-chain amino acid transport system substrate-binding protein